VIAKPVQAQPVEVDRLALISYLTNEPLKSLVKEKEGRVQMIRGEPTMNLQSSFFQNFHWTHIFLLIVLAAMVTGVNSEKKSHYLLKLLVWSDSEIAGDSQVVVVETIDTKARKRHFSSFDRRDKYLICREWCNSSLYPEYFPSFRELATMKPTRIDLAGNPQAAAVLNSLPPHEVEYERDFACNSKSGLTAYATVVVAIDTSMTPEERLKAELTPMGFTHPQGLVTILTLVDQQSKAITYVDAVPLNEPIVILKDPGVAFDSSGYAFYYGKQGATWKFDVRTGSRTQVSAEGGPAIAWNTGTVLIFSQQNEALLLLGADGKIVERMDGVDLQSPILTVYQIDESAFAIGSFVQDDDVQGMIISVVDFSRGEFQEIMHARSDGQILEAARLP
jgi:hypothetical protein